MWVDGRGYGGVSRYCLDERIRVGVGWCRLEWALDAGDKAKLYRRGGIGRIGVGRES